MNKVFLLKKTSIKPYRNYLKVSYIFKVAVALLKWPFETMELWNCGTMWPFRNYATVKIFLF